MIKIYPFCAVMPSQADAAAVASEPYDVINAEEARERAAGNDKSFLHVVRSEIDLPVGADPYDLATYETARSNLQQLLDDGVLQESETPGIFIYRQVFQGESQYGIVCCCDAEQYRANQIKKHEKTRPDKEDDRTRHMTICSAHAEPVFLTYRDTNVLEDLIRQDVGESPIIDFTADDGVQHTIWTTASPEEYVRGFQFVDSLYIADGHHRTAGGARAAAERQAANPNHTGEEEYNRILSVIFPASHLRILAYNRAVADLNGLTPSDFLAKLGEIGQLSAAGASAEPTSQGSVGLYVDGQWYQFTFPGDLIDRNDPINSLDVALLQNHVLEPLLGIDDPRTNQRISFIGGIRGTGELERLVDEGKRAVAFSMFPTTIEQLLNVSDAGEIMPPKSTWFEPKLRSGLFVHRFEP